MSESGEMPPPSEAPLTKDQKINIEREEEQKLREKYPQAAGAIRPGRPGGGHSAFLQKRLAKGQKYFDSGDYQMAKQKSRLPGAAKEGIPSGLATASAAAGASSAGTGAGGADVAAAGAASGAASGAAGRLTMPVLAQPPPTGETIPTPELVPMRKTSIIQPLHDHSQSMHPHFT